MKVVYSERRKLIVERRAAERWEPGFPAVCDYEKATLIEADLSRFTLHIAWHVIRTEYPALPLVANHDSIYSGSLSECIKLNSCRKYCQGLRLCLRAQNGCPLQVLGSDDISLAQRKKVPEHIAQPSSICEVMTFIVAGPICGIAGTKLRAPT
jgi:hypothetical protein